MKKAEPGTNPQLTLRTRLQQGVRQRYVLAGISVLLMITACFLYWLLQQTDLKAENRPELKAQVPVKVTSPVTIEAIIHVEDNIPVLNWKGDFPVGSQFVLERAEDGGNWELVQKVPKEEVMIAASSYRFTDTEAGGAKVRYRLTCLSADGASLTSEELKTGLAPHQEQLLTITGIEPLPFKNHFTINLEADKEEVISFEILDNNSAPVYSEVYKVQKGENLIGFTRGDKLPSGVYIIRLSGSDNATAMTKLVKQ